MAYHKSSEKRARQTIVKNERNRAALSKIKTGVKKFRTAVEALSTGTGDLAKTKEAFQAAQSLLRKAATKGLLHRNNSNRRVGRLAALLAKATTK